jgi:CMP-N-acetylneuraminic acid synthetase
MLEGKRVLAIVPARSGSKGIPDKNMRRIRGVSLIALAAEVLNPLLFLDARVISTDSQEYLEEGVRHGLSGPFLRPPHLATDQATAIETVRHALHESERHFRLTFDVILIVEPTCPLRQPIDIENAARLLLRSGADSVVSVSEVPAKFHPLKILRLVNGMLRYYDDAGEEVASRQQLQDKCYWRNGACYALTRKCVLEVGAILTANTLPLVIDRPLVNIDDPGELDYAELLAGHLGPSDLGAYGLQERPPGRTDSP